MNAFTESNARTQAEAQAEEKRNLIHKLWENRFPGICNPQPDHWPIKREGADEQVYCDKCQSLMGLNYDGGDMNLVCGGCGHKQSI